MIHNWRKIRILGTWILVQADARPAVTAGGVVLPTAETQAEKVREGSGRVLRLGTRVKEDLPDYPVKEGDRIAYRGFLRYAYRFMFEQEGECDIFVIDAKDVLAVIDDEVFVGIFS
jgi:co-chaperonin GroES (HSP10)